MLFFKKNGVSMAVLMVILVVLSSNATAGWSKQAVLENITIYVDSDTLIKSGNTVRMWHMTDFKNSQTTTSGEAFKSVKVHNEYNCTAMQTRLLAFSVHSSNMGEGKVVLNKTGSSKWTPNDPNQNSLWKTACGIAQ